MADVTIRHLEPDDYPAVQQIYAQPQVYAGTLQMPLPSLDLWAKRLINMSEWRKRLVACMAEQVVGLITIDSNDRERRRHVASFGIVVDPAYTGQGVGSALMAAMIDLCDNWLNMHRIELTVFVDNAAAIALYRKFGFEVEGTSRDFAFREGRYVDVHHMGRIRPAA
ncbi:GNAT family N-acetyltransferase [Pseudomonas sp. 5P_3.1_Bac2]|uniref:GNAT family N-acetyltransferase n=1 Tax=Pseudomonas sp. 5P_3.1_Bac2 TaxID=2971617 RepID=UPI0021C73989|nr:GNAT family N-acetyltransferase [Pseudomonas sp. 5P_3.1_Bac2]MCU1716065.1 GNAT family N-acetyltransferase [Pseudomonas sp. 5P_3.1_Bac2]